MCVGDMKNRDFLEFEEFHNMAQFLGNFVGIFTPNTLFIRNMMQNFELF